MKLNFVTWTMLWSWSLLFELCYEADQREYYKLCYEADPRESNYVMKLIHENLTNYVMKLIHENLIMLWSSISTTTLTAVEGELYLEMRWKYFCEIKKNLYYYEKQRDIFVKFRKKQKIIFRGK